MILIFVLGYLCIALEHKLRIDKAAIALLMCGALWTVLSLLGNDAQIGTQLIEQLGDTSEILFFLIGAMTIVELIDRHGGFHVITDHIKTRNKRKLLWLLSIITFFMSAVLDNMTTTIIMIMLLRRMISRTRPRSGWIFASGHRHRGQQRRCLFAHRRRNDHHALDAGQRHLGPARGQTVPPGPGIGNHSHGHRLPLYSRRKRASRKIRHGARAAAVRRPALQPLRSRSRCRRAAVRAHIQGCNGTAALPGHADIVGCAVGLHGARL